MDTFREAGDPESSDAPWAPSWPVSAWELAAITPRQLVRRPLTAGTPGRTRAAAFPAIPASRRRASRMLRAAFTAWRLPTTAIDDLGLIAGELITNAIRHAGPTGAGAFAVAAQHWLKDEELVLLVQDENTTPPHRPSTSVSDAESAIIDTLAESGRGLGIVANLADRLGWYPLPTGKVVWAGLQVSSVHPDSAQRAERGRPHSWLG